MYYLLSLMQEQALPQRSMDVLLLGLLCALTELRELPEDLWSLYPARAKEYEAEDLARCRFAQGDGSDWRWLMQLW